MPGRRISLVCQTGTSPKKERTNWRRMVGLNVIVSFVAVALLSIFMDVHTVKAVFTLFAMCFIYSFTIGSFCAIVLSNFAPDPENSRSVWAWVVLVVEIVVTAAIGTFIASLILLVLGLQPRAVYWQTLFMTLKFSCIMGLTFGVAMYLYESTRERLRLAKEELQRKQLDEERARKLAAEARLSSLESRIHPHFLFNTLNSIAALIPEDPRRAEEIVQKLAALLRFSLDANQRRLVPLAQELKVVGDYLEIEKARFGARLRYSLDVPPELQGALVPPLCVETLVENAVKYAVAPRREGGRIRVEACPAKNGVLLAVCDDGPGFNITDAPAGHGIENLQERLSALYGDEGCLEVSREGNEWTTVRLLVPTNVTTGNGVDAGTLAGRAAVSGREVS